MAKPPRINPNTFYPSTEPTYRRNVFDLYYRSKLYKVFFYNDMDENEPNWFVDVIRIDKVFMIEKHCMYDGFDKYFDHISAYSTKREMMAYIERVASLNTLEIMEFEEPTE